MRDHQFNLSSVAAKPCTSSAPLQQELQPAARQQSDPAVAVDQQSLSEGDEDADLHIPLAFAAKAEPTPSCKYHAGIAPNDGELDAAFGSNIAGPTALSQERAPCYQSHVPELEQDEERCFSAMADLGSQPTAAAK